MAVKKTVAKKAAEVNIDELPEKLFITEACY